MIVWKGFREPVHLGEISSGKRILDFWLTYISRAEHPTADMDVHN